MKKLIIILLLFSISVFAIENNYFSNKVKTIPLTLNLLSSENGGELTAIDAYSDGVGLFILGEEDKKIIAMNELVYKYGEEAKKNNETLKDFVINNGNSEEIKLANLLGTGNTTKTEIGASCNDGNNSTINDIYIDINGTCKGTVIKTENKCFGDTIGSSFFFNENSYLVVDNTTIRENLNRAETLCTSNVTDMSYMFTSSSFNQDISNWDASNVIDMYGMFMDSTFNQNISNWDTSNVIDMSYMFSGSTFNQPLSLNTINVTNMTGMFSYSNFNQPLTLNTINVTNMFAMFTYSIFNQSLTLNTINVTNMSSMFSDSKFNQPLTLNTINVTNMSAMFANSIFNNSLNLNTINVTDMRAMFRNNIFFNQDLSHWCVSKIMTEPKFFRTSATNFSQLNQPNWGTCN